MGINLGVAKIIFYGYMCLQNYENVEIVTNSPTRCETIVDTKELKIPVKSSYHNILENGEGYDVVFRNLPSWEGGCTCLYNTETREIGNVLKEKYYLNHNFCVIKSKCGTKYYGIGGEHTEEYIAYRIRRKKRIDKEPMICYGGVDIVSPDVFSKYHHNGLYLMQSSDMIHWEYAYPVPVISGIHPGHTDHFWGFSKFDSKISCFYSEMLGRYVLFIRANMGKGRRWVQTTSSEDLIHWEPFRLLKMEGVDFDNDNYYHMDVMEYLDAGVFIGLSAYTNRPRYPTETYIKLMFSRDGLHWIDRGSMLDTPTCSAGYRNSVQTTSVFFDRGDHYDMFFNENYNGILDRNESATVVRYEIPKDRLVGVKSNGVGRFSFDMIIRSDQMVLNYDCHGDGYLKFTINSDGEEFILRGDELNKVVAIDGKYIGQDVRVHVEMKDTILYSYAS